MKTTLSGSVKKPLVPWDVRIGDVITLDDGRGARVTGPVVEYQGTAPFLGDGVMRYRNFQGFLVKVVRRS